MQSSNLPAESADFMHPHEKEARASGVSWGAVIGGAFVAAAVYMILLALGAGLELSAISPWSNAGVSATTFGTEAIIWLILMEVISSAMGGYLTGRLRTKWALIHTDEVFFRDTANGFVAWTVALIITVTLLGSAAAYMVGSVEQRSPAPGSAPGVSGAELYPNAYFVDRMFRANRFDSPIQNTLAQTEAARIVANALRRSDIPEADLHYLATSVAARTGLGYPEAEKRVSDVMTEARQTEDAARKVTARFLLWFFIALLAGALTASYAATIGGRQRDGVQHVYPRA